MSLAVTICFSSLSPLFPISLLRYIFSVSHKKNLWKNLGKLQVSFLLNSFPVEEILDLAMSLYYLSCTPSSFLIVTTLYNLMSKYEILNMAKMIYIFKQTCYMLVLPGSRSDLREIASVSRQICKKKLHHLSSNGGFFDLYASICKKRDIAEFAPFSKYNSKLFIPNMIRIKCVGGNSI